MARGDAGPPVTAADASMKRQTQLSETQRQLKDENETSNQPKNLIKRQVTSPHLHKSVYATWTQPEESERRTEVSKTTKLVRRNLGKHVTDY